MATNNNVNIGQVRISQQTRSTIALQNFAPKPNVSLGEIAGVSTTGVQDGYTLIFSSSTGSFESAPVANLTGQISHVTGGFF